MAVLVKHVCLELALDHAYVARQQLKFSLPSGHWTIELSLDCDDDEFPFAEACVYLCKSNRTADQFLVTSRTCIVDWNKVEHEVIERKNFFNADIVSNSIWCTSTDVLKNYLSEKDCYRSYFKIELWLSGRFQSQDVDDLQEGPMECLNKTQSGLERLSYDLDQLLDHPLVSDVVLKAGNNAINAHKVILSARSEVFKAMFQNDMSESRENIVIIEDIENDILEIFVRYLYSGKLSVMSMNTTSHLYAIADKYAVEELKTKCGIILSSSFTKDNVLLVLDMADSHSDETLKKKAIDFVLQNEEVLYSNQWDSFSESCPKLAIQVYKAFLDKQKTKQKLVLWKKFTENN